MRDILKIDQWRIPATLPTPPAQGEIHLWKIDLLSPGLDLSPLLSSDEQQRRAQLRRQDARICFGNARGALRHILSGYIHTPPERIAFSYGDKGKPYLQPPHSDIQFNLSHAGKLALLIIGNNLPVGVDLEPSGQRKNLRRIARKVFTPELYQQIEPLNEADFQQAFFQHWTALEARVKAVGAGVFSPTAAFNALPCISFEPQPGWCAAVAADGTLPPIGNWRALQFSPDLDVPIG